MLQRFNFPELTVAIRFGFTIGVALMVLAPVAMEAKPGTFQGEPVSNSKTVEGSHQFSIDSERLLVQSDAQPPAISIDTLREGGVSGFDEPSSSPMFIRSEHWGIMHSGWALPVDPGEQLEFSLETEGEEPSAWSSAAAPGRSVDRLESTEFQLRGGRLRASTSGRYQLTAPGKPGNYPFHLKVTRRLLLAGKPDGPPLVREFKLTVLVKTPFDRSGNGLIGDFPIGIYPNEKGRNVSGFVQQHRELYAPPSSFILVTPEVEKLQISPHFVLGDFVSPPDRGKASYIALDPRLLELLETAITELRPQFATSGGKNPLVILSAFLSPNQLMQLGAKGVELTLFTRYQYGDGAAIIWDADGDGRMDDLNRDEVIDVEDARQFADLLGEVQRKLKKYGGIGVEASPQLPFMPETPYVDVDMRGVSSRW